MFEHNISLATDKQCQLERKSEKILIFFVLMSIDVEKNA